MSTSAQKTEQPSTAKRRILHAVSRNRSLLTDPDALLPKLLAKAVTRSSNVENQEGSVQWDTIVPPFDYEGAMVIREYNTHHSTCLEQLTSAVASRGFWNDTVADKLNAKCDMDQGGYLPIFKDGVDNYFELGGFALEVVRDAPGKSGNNATGIRYIQRMPGERLRVHRYKDKSGDTDWCWEVVASGYHAAQELMRSAQYTVNVTGGETDKLHARFGHKDKFIADDKGGNRKPEEISEIIYIPQNRTRSRYYGRPRWISATPSMEMVQLASQHEFNFYFNRGVPEFALIVTGATIEEEEWEEMEAKLLQHVGLDNSHQSIAINFSNPEVEVQLEKLGMDAEQENRFTTDIDTLALMIVTAHGVPPMMANIQLPGRAGATNELMNAILQFQLTSIDGYQIALSLGLAGTLGNPKLNGGIGLTMDDFLVRPESSPSAKTGRNNAWRRMTDDIDLLRMETMGNMRQEVGSPTTTRNLDDGPARNGRDLNGNQ